MGIRMAKRWIGLEPDGGPVDGTDPVAALPAQLGVFQLADADGEVILIGLAGATEPFGLRSAVTAALERCRHLGPRHLRYELTHAYLSRHRELLMVHHHDRGRLPAGNDEPVPELGRLQPGPAPAETSAAPGAR